MPKHSFAECVDGIPIHIFRLAAFRDTAFLIHFTSIFNHFPSIPLQMSTRNNWSWNFFPRKQNNARTWRSSQGSFIEHIAIDDGRWAPAVLGLATFRARIAKLEWHGGMSMVLRWSWDLEHGKDQRFVSLTFDTMPDLDEEATTPCRLGKPPRAEGNHRRFSYCYGVKQRCARCTRARVKSILYYVVHSIRITNMQSIN